MVNAHYDFNYQLDIFVLLDLLDRVQAGVCRAVILVPPASTWSRARHFGPKKCPLRSRAHPLGLPHLATSDQSRIHDSNIEVEVSTLFAAEALECKTRAVSAVLLFPEDLAGHSVSGPASPWCLKEWRELDGLGALVPTSSVQSGYCQTFSHSTVRLFLAGPYYSYQGENYCTTALSHVPAAALVPIKRWWVSLTILFSTLRLSRVFYMASGCAFGRICPQFLCRSCLSFYLRTMWTSSALASLTSSSFPLCALRWPRGVPFVCWVPCRTLLSLCRL